MDRETPSSFVPEEASNDLEKVVEKATLPELGCELTELEVSDGVPLDKEPASIGHVDACEPCQRLVSGSQGNN